jgi:purine nucleosidase
MIDRIAALGGTAASMAAELLASLCRTHRPGVLTPVEAPLHDPCAVLVAAQPGIATTVKARVDIDTAQGLNYGRTIVDFAGRSDKPANCDVVIAFNVAATHEALVASIAALAMLQSHGPASTLETQPQQGTR